MLKTPQFPDDFTAALLDILTDWVAAVERMAVAGSEAAEIEVSIDDLCRRQFAGFDAIQSIDLDATNRDRVLMRWSFEGSPDLLVIADQRLADCVAAPATISTCSAAMRLQTALAVAASTKISKLQNAARVAVAASAEHADLLAILIAAQTELVRLSDER